MRVAVVVHNGIKRDARVLKGASSLKSMGHDVRLFGLTPNSTEDFELPNGSPVHLQHRDLTGIRARMAEEGLEVGRENAIWTSFRTQGDIIFDSVQRTFEPDMVHIHDHLAFTAASKYKDAFGCPIVWDAHEIYEDMASIAPERAAVNSRIIQGNAGYADGFITLNQSIADFYRDKYPKLPEPVLIPNAVERTSQAPYDGRLHRAAGLVPDQKILLFQGGLAPKRGIPSLLEASRQLREDWTLVFMGWGALEDEIRDFATANSDRPTDRARIRVVPGAPHDELLLWTAGATLGTIPYENTGLNHLYCSPNKLWEYPAAGVPMLVTDLPEMRKKIEQYDVGTVVGQELNPDEIATAIHSLTDEDLTRMKINCGTFSIEENWQNYEKQIFDLYAELKNPSGTSSGSPDPSVPATTNTSWFKQTWRGISQFFANRD